MPKLLSPWKISCAFIELWMHLRSLERTQEARVALGYPLKQFLHFFPALQTSRDTKHEPIHLEKKTVNSYRRRTQLKLLMKNNLENVKKICTLLTYTLHNILIINYIATTAKLCWMTFWKRNRICAFQPRKGVKPDWY